jgi:uncharacterized protein
MDAARTEVRFPSGEDHCGAWLYRPTLTESKPVPIVVLAHGLGALKEACLDRYAERFAEAGMAALVFDYRHFGSSTGQPRRLLDIRRQREDWAAAIAYARTLEGVDRDRVALWGSSFGGGHVLWVAAQDRRIAAAVVQCPFTHGLASAGRLGLRSLPKVIALGIRDRFAALRSAPGVQIEVAGPPGSAALMTASDALPGYQALQNVIPAEVFDGSTVAARVALDIPWDHPVRAAGRTRCPILFCVCDHDSVAPPGPTLRAARKAPHGETVRYPIGHFDIYFGEPFEQAVHDQTEFLRGRLLPS